MTVPGSIHGWQLRVTVPFDILVMHLILRCAYNVEKFHINIFTHIGDF